MTPDNSFELPSSTLESLDRDLRRLAERAPDLARGALAASARKLAGRIDDPKDSLTSQTMAVAQLRATMDRLWELAPEPAKKGRLDAIKSGRTERRAGGTAPAA